MEIGRLRAWFRPGMKVLELGGGSGYQADILSSWGSQVESLDVELPSCAAGPVYHPVRLYDGLHIPAGAESFDAIYSSHVLYYMLRSAEFFAEMRRVLRPPGLAIHVLPTPTWRVLTSLTYYPFFAIRAAGRLLGRARSSPPAPGGPEPSPPRSLLALLVAGPLGPARSAWAECIEWRKDRLIRLLSDNGFVTVKTVPLGLLESGHMLLGDRLPLSIRRALAVFAGSSSIAFVTRRADEGAARLAASDPGPGRRARVTVALAGDEAARWGGPAPARSGDPFERTLSSAAARSSVT